MLKKRKIVWAIISLLIIVVTYEGVKILVPMYRYDIGEPVDSLNGVYVYYNRSISNVEGRNTKDGYNLGLEYQCVEFVKRYYYDYFNHKMPDSYGHAKSFFNKDIKDGELNLSRNLWQYSNPGKSKPKINDLIVMGHSRYGHVAIISDVTEDNIEIIQQNPGINSPSRIRIKLSKIDSGLWLIEKKRVLGWLRK